MPKPDQDSGALANSWLQQGIAAIQLGQPLEAVKHLKRVLKLMPKAAPAHANLGVAFRALGRTADAIASAQRAVKLTPEPVPAPYWLVLGHALLQAEKWPEAAKAYAETLARGGQGFDLHMSYGEALKNCRRYAEACEQFAHALVSQPDSALAAAKLGETKIYVPDLAGATQALRLAIELSPDDDKSMHNLAVTELKTGQFSPGWEKYEVRFKATQVKMDQPSAIPRWSGDDLSGRRLLVWPEQGIGEQVLFAGVLPDVIARAEKVYVDVEPRLQPIFARSFPTATILTGGVDAARVIPKDVDHHIPMGSIARAFRRDFNSFPRHAGYLKADPDRTRELREKCQALAGSRRIVGISWRSKNFMFGERKSAALEDFAEVLRQPGIMFVNLQYGDCTADLSAIKRKFGVTIYQDPTVDSLRDLDSFLALVAAMDLVISTSNTCIHIAGAANVPGWLLLPKGAGSMWYWFLDREDSPWYPSLRLLRQPDSSDAEPWVTAVVARAATELKTWLETT